METTRETIRKNTKFNIVRYSFNSELIELFNDVNKSELDCIKEKRYKASELKVSRRVLSHWKSLGLIDLYHENSDSSKLSFLELFWLQIAIELRAFGMSLDTINSIKDSFFTNSKLPVFETYLLLSIFIEHRDYFMVVSSDGRAQVGSGAEIKISESLGLLEEPYIKLNFNIIKNEFVTDKLSIINDKSSNNTISKDEISIINLIRSGEYEEISLKFNNGVITHVSKKVIEQNPDPFKELRKIVKSGNDFCEITIKRANGKFVSMKSNIMEKP